MLYLDRTSEHTWSTSRRAAATGETRRSTKARCAREASAESGTRSSHTWCRACQANWQASSSRARNTRPSRQSRSSGSATRGCSESCSRVCWGWSVDRQRDYVRTANDGESDCASLFSLGDCLRCAGCSFASSSSPSELFCVGENEVHVLYSVSMFRLRFLTRLTLSNASICPTICLPS